MNAKERHLHTSILFVCMGNICRSPTAQGVFEYLLATSGFPLCCDVDSAGTISYHAGNPPDARATAAALARGIDLTEQRARQIREEDYYRFDHILAMDQENLDYLIDHAPRGQRGKIELFMTYAGDPLTHEVPDPYYGGAQGFDYVLDLLTAASQGLLDVLVHGRAG